MMRIGFLPCLVLVSCGVAFSQEHAAPSMEPSEFVLGRHTFFDFGPPFDYYELFLVKQASDGISVEKLTLTPAADKCFAPAKVEYVKTSVHESVEALFAGKSPCSIPEKELHHELKRGKRQLVFSGANVALEVQCGEQTRLIRADILDKDMFDPNPKTPKNTSWTMGLLERLDQAAGPSVMDKPVFPISQENQPTSQAADSEAMSDLAAGKYDAIFGAAPDKPSDLYRAAQVKLPEPSVKLVSTAPLGPDTVVLPVYPRLARVAHVEGKVNFSLMVNVEGRVTEVIQYNGQPLFRGVITDAVRSWKFPAGNSDREIQVTLEFKLNCQSQSH
jgi:hypothetical protein